MRIGTASLVPSADTALYTRFVRGQYFVLDEDEQLTAPPTAVHASGTRVQPAGASTGAGHLVDDSYETAYKPEQTRQRSPWRGALDSEIAPRWLAGERLTRWITADAGIARVSMNTPTLRVATERPLVGLVAGGPVATPVDLAPDADPWRMLHSQARTAADSERLLESWELP